MTRITNQVLDDALHLPRTARAFVAEKLLESLDIDDDFEISEEWRQEIIKRCLDIDDGAVGLIPAEKVFEDAFEKLK